MLNLTDKTPFLGCERVSVQFFDRDTPALQDISIRIAEKESVLLLGPSGCGKSTLAQVLSGIIPRSIEAWMKGEVYRPDRVGVMFQDPDAQFCMLTVEDEIAFSLENRQVPPAQMREQIERLMRQVRLDLPLDKRIAELSGGLKQRLALACLLALEPDVLFFDEPTAQLDPENTGQVLQDIARLRGEKTLVMIEHKLESVMEWIDRVFLFGPDGALQGSGKPEQVLRDHQEAIKRYGIWTPRMWPVTWRELLDDPQHELSQRLERQWRAGNREAGDVEGARIQAELLGAEPATKAPVSPSDAGQHSGREPLLQVRDAELCYRNGQAVWSDVNVSVQPGEWVAIMGPNGAGKSTFLKMVGGLLPAKSGQVLLKGIELGKYKSDALYDCIGFVFQNPEHQFIADTVFDEVAFGGRLARWPKERVERETERLLADFHLQAVAQKNPFTLSQGQKRRLSVAGMLLKNQELLLLDEPTFGQDAATTRELVERIRERNAAGTTVMMATHDVELVASTASRVLVFAEQGLLFDGTAHELFSRPDLLKRASLTEPLAHEYQRRCKERKEEIVCV
ncbi:ABC transporter ATP-binding protein [Tumebacillus lipolyticus]|uniref:ABC transporter ATP-binding protein n=1 Tax=Tumebacillus lipolyticus TaxID=1280370 RepID=A0ABW5A1I6_9BACL